MQGEIFKEGKKKNTKYPKTTETKKSSATKLKETKQELFLRALRDGHAKSEVRELLGIPVTTYKNWHTKDKNFAALECQAEAECVAKLHTIVIESAYKDPKMALAILERLRPERYAPVQHRQKDATPPPSQSPLEALTALIKANMGKMTEEDRQAFERIIKLLPPEEAS